VRISMTVVNNDGSAVDVTASTADLVAFEREWDRSVARFSDDFRLTDFCWLAWHASKRLNKTGLAFEEWLDTVDEVSAKGDGDIVPLETTQPIG
jgi:hypothetical protein